MRKILLAVSGLSPQILTESIFALALRRSKPFIPHEVHLITTSEGANRARLLLLSEKPGWYHRLLADYALPDCGFSEHNIHVLCNGEGEQMDDIRTPEDNAAAADFIVSLVRELTINPNSCLHASIAGGRKSMGFYLGYAMSLYGREQDELSHVLVSDPYESLTDFFFPTRESQIVYSRGGKPLDSSLAEVWLASIPFVRMRQGIPDALLEGNSSFSTVVDAASRAFIAPHLSIQSAERCLRTPIGNTCLAPAEFAFYLMLVRLRKQGKAALHCPPDGCPDIELGNLFMMVYTQINNGLGGLERTGEALRCGMNKSYFEQRKSRINKSIRLALGVNGSPYEIARRGSPGSYHFGLFHLAAEQIRIDQS